MMIWGLGFGVRIINLLFLGSSSLVDGFGACGLGSFGFFWGWGFLLSKKNKPGNKNGAMLQLIMYHCYLMGLTYTVCIAYSW